MCHSLNDHEQINHDPAHTYMNTGTQISGRPSMGSWILYGLGAETNNLPGFVVLTSVGGGQNQPIASHANGIVAFYLVNIREFTFIVKVIDALFE